MSSTLSMTNMISLNSGGGGDDDEGGNVGGICVKKTRKTSGSAFTIYEL